LERLVYYYLKNNRLTIHSLTVSQYTYRRSRSTDTALHHLVTKIEMQLEAKGSALGVFLDIKGIFDSTLYTVIREAMIRHNIPTALADWSQSILTRRSIIANCGNLTLESKPTKGCPQGGVLSPLLWCLVVNELLVKLPETGLSIYDYANDVAIVARSSFLSTLKELIDKAFKIVYNWCQATGLNVNPSKTEAI